MGSFTGTADFGESGVPERVDEVHEFSEAIAIPQVFAGLTSSVTCRVLASRERSDG